MTVPVLRTRARLLPWAAAAMIAVGACSTAATSAPATQAPPTAAPPTAAPASSAPASEAPTSPAPPASASASAASGTTYTLAVATGAGSIGKYLTGEDGKTLYTFKKDTAGGGTSACSGTCSTNWPAFTLDAGETAVGGAGATGTIATFTRADGKVQVTYNGAPLYYFAADTKAGDTNGQGVGGFWFVAAP
jgi:predicted lipoprotein with Yx(FWY)xxD motif